MKFKKIFTLFIIGALTGVTIGTTNELIFSACFQSKIYTPGVPEFLNSFNNIHLAVLIERIIYALLGALSFASSLVFEIEKFSLAKATGINFTITLSIALLSGLYLKWYPGFPALLGFAIIFSAIYFCIWIAWWFYYKNTINKIKIEP